MSPSYEGGVKQARSALESGNTFEAREWVSKALGTKPESPEAQKLMAEVISREVAGDKLLSESTFPEELTPYKRKLQIKTWLERSQGFLQVNEFDEALTASEQVFRLDPENLEASRMIDSIKEKARKQGYRESRFLQGVYHAEAERRIQLYLKQAEVWIQEKKWGTARLALEKALLLDPQNPSAQKLLAVVDKEGERRVE